MSDTTITDSAVIASYNRGPLTTVFKPPPSCLSTLTLADHMYYGHDGTDYYDSACYPSSISSTYTFLADNGNWNQYYYSPGQCPDAWAHATTFTSYFTNAGDSSGQMLFSLGSDTTAVLCCPSGYVYYGVEGHQCGTTILSSGAQVLYASTTLSNNAVVLATPATSTISSAYTIWGDGIPIWWQSKDLAAFTAPALTTTSTSSTSTNTASSTIATSTGSSSPPLKSGSSGLSSGAKIAIGVTIPVVLIAAVLGIFFYFRKSGKNRAQGEKVKYPNSRGELATDGALSELESRVPQHEREGVRPQPFELPDRGR